MLLLSWEVVSLSSVGLPDLHKQFSNSSNNVQETI